MSHKLKRYEPCMESEPYFEYDYASMEENPTGLYYNCYEVDEYVEELHKRIKALEERAGAGCDSEEHF